MFVCLKKQKTKKKHCHLGSKIYIEVTVLLVLSSNIHYVLVNLP